MSETWDAVQYPSHPFEPPSPPSTWLNPLWMSAIDQSLHQQGAMPTYPIEYVYLLPSAFFQMEPSDQRNPVYYEAWQNLSTRLMPEYNPETLWGDIHNYPYHFGGTTHPPTYISPPESWHNLSTWLMPEYGSESLWGDVHNWPNFFQVVSTPTFLPDGVGVTSPTSTSPSPGIGSGRSKTERV